MMLKGGTWTATITGIGAYVPDSRLTNADLEKIVDTSDEWIVQRTGIRERRICAPDQFTSDLCEAAVSDMLARYPVHLDDTELVIVATHTPDFPFPPVSCQIQDRFGLSRAGAVDLNATCAGFVYALHLANGLVSAGIHSKILVIGADAMSKITDYTDRSTCILFGDGAGAVLIERKRGEHQEAVFLGSQLGADGSGGIHLYRTGIANKMNGIPLKDTSRLVQNGREVYKWAVQTVPEGVRQLSDQAGVPLEEVDWLVPHSANLRMIESICSRIGFPIEKTLYSMVWYGNTSAASIPLALSDAAREGRIKAGDMMMLYGFGGGMTHAGMLIRWPLNG